MVGVDYMYLITHAGTSGRRGGWAYNKCWRIIRTLWYCAILEWLHVTTPGYGIG